MAKKINFEVGSVVRCIKNDNFERMLIINKNYIVDKIDDKTIDVRSKLQTFKNIPIEYFQLNEYNFKEERSIIEDIKLIDDVYNNNIEEQIADVNYIYAYYAMKKNDAIKKLSILEDGFSIWYHETIMQLDNDLTKNILDPKLVKDIRSQYSTQNKEERLIIKYRKKEYEDWKNAIREQTKVVNDLSTIVKSIEMKSLNLNVINKNRLFELGTYPNN